MDNRIKSAGMPYTLEMWRDSQEDQDHDYRIKNLVNVCSTGNLTLEHESWSLWGEEQAHSLQLHEIPGRKKGTNLHYG